MIGLVEIAVVTTVIGVLYGRTGIFQSRQFQAIWPYISPQRRGMSRPGATAGESRARGAAASAKLKRKRGLPSFEGNKLYWFLTILAATAVSTWIVTRLVISSGWGPGLSP